MNYCIKESPGLRILEKLVLPKRSYITELGVLSLLQNLQFLHIMEFLGHFPHVQFRSNSSYSLGNMGKVFELDWEPNFGSALPHTNFAQMMSMSSGGVEVFFKKFISW